LSFHIVLFLVYSVVCRQLGFGVAIGDYPSYFANASTPIWLNEVHCTTGDRYLSECSNNGWGNDNCEGTKYAGVICNGTGTVLLK